MNGGWVIFQWGTSLCEVWVLSEKKYSRRGPTLILPQPRIRYFRKYPPPPSEVKTSYVYQIHVMQVGIIYQVLFTDEKYVGHCQRFLRILNYRQNYSRMRLVDTGNSKSINIEKIATQVWQIYLSNNFKAFIAVFSSKTKFS